MKQPTTIAQAKKLTLDKIRECMKLPIDERGVFWITPIWDNRVGLDKYCAFCLVIDCGEMDTNPVCLKACRYYSRRRTFSNDFLNELYRMVEEVEG